MNDKTKQLQQLAKDLLTSGEAKQIIGFRRGTEPYRSAPVFVTSPEDCAQLLIDCTCTQNLAAYVRKLPDKAAIVVKGCDARALAVLLSENQLKRDDLVIIGVPCEGLVDLTKFKQIEGVTLDAVTSLQIEGGEVVVQMGDKTVRVLAADVLRDECLGCQCPTPPLADHMLGDEIAPRDEAKFRELQDKLEAMTQEEREAYFEGNFSRCIRCYACVKACPMCYCTTCFAIQDKPQYVPRTVGLDENRMFHLGRAMHLAGRCVACGACDRACPVDIPLRALNTKLASETKDLFGIEAGLSMDQKPPLVEFLPGDTEDVLDKAD